MPPKCTWKFTDDDVVALCSGESTHDQGRFFIAKILDMNPDLSNLPPDQVEALRTPGQSHDIIVKCIWFKNTSSKGIERGPWVEMTDEDGIDYTNLSAVLAPPFRLNKGSRRHPAFIPKRTHEWIDAQWQRLARPSP